MVEVRLFSRGVFSLSVVFLIVIIMIVVFYSAMYVSLLTLILSVLALTIAALSYTYRISPSLTVRLETLIAPATYLYPLINYGGVDPLFPGEQYLELILVNGGPGVAKNITWFLEIIGYKEREEALSGGIPVLESRGKVTVQGYLKIDHKIRAGIAYRYKSEHNLPPDIDLSNEQIKDVQRELNRVKKYIVHLCYGTTLSGKKTGVTLSFNEDGRYINQEMEKCVFPDDRQNMQLSSVAGLPKAVRAIVLAEGVFNVFAASAFVFIGFFREVPHYFGWIATVVAFLNYALAPVLFSVYSTAGLKWWVRRVEFLAKNGDSAILRNGMFVFFMLLGALGIAIGLSNIAVGLEGFEFNSLEIDKYLIVLLFAIISPGIGMKTGLSSRRTSKSGSDSIILPVSISLFAILLDMFSVVMYAVRALSGTLFYIAILALLLSIILMSDLISSALRFRP